MAAEGLGVLSSVLLFVPAVGLNKHLRAIKTSQDQFARSTTALSQAIAQQSRPTLEQSRVPAWSKRDENLLLLGILAFALSSGIKFAVACGALPTQPQTAVGAATAGSAPGSSSK